MLSGGELIIILLVTFLVFGPKRLPELARTLGKFMYEIREGMHNATVEIKKEYREMEETTGEDRSPGGKENPEDGPPGGEGRKS